MRLISKYGNEVVYTDDQRKIERLKEQGFKEQELPKTKKELPKKEGEQKSDVKQRKIRTEKDI